jgi:hypothetical protein
LDDAEFLSPQASPNHRGLQNRVTTNVVAAVVVYPPRRAGTAVFSPRPVGAIQKTNVTLFGNRHQGLQLTPGGKV